MPDHAIPLPKSPRPSTGDELERLVRDVLFQDEAGSGVVVLSKDHVVVRAAMEGADVRSLLVDLTGLELRFEDHPDDDAPGTPGGPEAEDVEPGEADGPGVVRLEPAVLSRAVVRADPIVVHGVPVTVEAEANDVAFEWVDLDDGTFAVRSRPERRRLFGRSPRARLRGAVDPDVVLRVVGGLLREALAAEKVRLSGEHLRLRAVGGRSLRIDAGARVRWKLFRPRFRLRTTLTVGNDFVARLRGTRVTSSNPFLHVGLLAFRRRMNKEIQRRVALDEYVAPWRFRDLRFRTGRQLELDAQLELRA